MAKVASIVIALFSFIVAPLLMLAPEGLWQIIRIFTGFYNIPVIAIVIVGLFTTKVPAQAAKVVIIFHVITYALLKFVFEVDINFIHIYAILFVIEVGIMLAYGHWQPKKTAYQYENKHKVDLTPWKYAHPVALTLATCIVISFLFFSNFGIVGGDLQMFSVTSVILIIANVFACRLLVNKWLQKYARPGEMNEKTA